MEAGLTHSRVHAAFRYSLWALLICTVLIAVTFLPGMGEALQSQRWRWLVQIVGGMIGVCGALSGSFIWFGMLIHCLITKNLNRLPKLVWVSAMLIVNIVAAICYYFAVYTAGDKASRVHQGTSETF